MVALTIGSLDEKRTALGAPPCSWTTHRKLRQQFTAVLVTYGPNVLDTHEDYIRGGGQMELLLFVGSIEGS